MIRHEPLTSEPLVLPGMLRLAHDGRRITRCWLLLGDQETRLDSPEELWQYVTDCWKSSSTHSDERWQCTHLLLANDASVLLALGLQLRTPPDASRTREIALRGPLDSLSGLVVQDKRLRVSLSLYSSLAQAEADPRTSLLDLSRELVTLAETFRLGGRLPLSLAGVARRHIAALVPDRLLTPWAEKQLDLEQRAVTPGRIEAVGPGIYPDCRQYDRHGSYTADIATMRLPESATCVWTNVYRGDGIYEVDYWQPEGIPLLRDEESRQFQLAGHGVFCSPELDELRAIGGAFQVRRGLHYRRVSAWLSPLGTFCWETRRQSRGLAARAAKHLPLFAYGVFLSKGERRNVLETETALASLREGRRVQLIPGSDFAVTIDTPEHAPFRFPGLGAFVLSYGRVALYRAMVAATDRGGRIISTYVDNLVVQAGELATGNDLGEWRLEASGHAAVVNPQQVVVGERVRAGGVGGDREQQRDALWLAAGGTPQVVTFSRPPTAGEVLGKGAAPLELQPRQSVVRIHPTDEEAIPYLLEALTRPINWPYLAENDRVVVNAIAAEHGWQADAYPDWFERPYWRSLKTQRRRLAKILRTLDRLPMDEAAD